jgi:hypothetical protein
MKFIDTYSNQSGKSSAQYLYDKSGSLTAEESEKIFAKVLDIDLGNDKSQKKFFIRTFNNTPFDPLGPDSRREIWNRTELKLVSQNTFEHYIMYLRSKNALYMTRTQRSFING